MVAAVAAEPSFLEREQAAAALRARRLRQARQTPDITSPALEYLTDPVGFITRFIPSFDMAPYQVDILEPIGAGGRSAARGPRGLGKTAVSAVTLIWFCIVNEAAGLDWKAVVTSGSHFQLRAYFWPEVHKWVRAVDWAALGIEPWRTDVELLKTGISLTYGMASSASPDRPELIEGAHAEGAVLIIFDESKAIPRTTFDAIEGVFSNIGPGSSTRGYALAVSTPGAPAGAFYDIHKRRPGTETWTVRQVRLDEAIDAGRVTREWADNLATLWGTDSPLYANHVAGEFAADDEDSVIPISWIEAAVLRWQERMTEGSMWVPPPMSGVGVDVARQGRDRTVVAMGYGHDHVGELRRLPRQDTAATTSDVAQILRLNPMAHCTVDSDGMGVGVADELSRQGFDVAPFFGGEGVPDWRDVTGHLAAFNRRSAAWWHVRELLDPRLHSTLALPPDDELIGDLTGPKRKADPKGRIKLEDKAQTKARLGRSPDAGDAVIYLLAYDLVIGEILIPWSPSPEWVEGRQPGVPETPIPTVPGPRGRDQVPPPAPAEDWSRRP